MKQRALTITDKFKFEYKDIEVPVVDADTAIIKVAFVGFCGSDLNTYRGVNPLAPFPRIIGHEITGNIHELGKNAPKNLSKGEKCIILPYTNCGKCSACLMKRPNACKNNQTLGVQRDGGMTQFIKVPYEKIITFKDSSLQDMALVEPLAVGFHASRRAQVKKGDITLVFGCGVIGLGTIAGSRNSGGTVIAVDISNEKLEMGKKAGAHYTINSLTKNLGERVLEITNGHGAHVAIEAVGLALTFKQAIDVVCYGGRVTYIGYAKEPVSYETKLFLLKELNIYGSRGAEKIDFENVLKYLQKGIFPIKDTISKVVSLEDAGEALAYWAENTDKVTKILIKF